MKDDLIRRWDALEALNKQQPLTKSVMRRVVMQVPAVDAVEVVRCGECKCWNACSFGRFMLGENGFCSYGERWSNNG